MPEERHIDLNSDPDFDNATVPPPDGDEADAIPEIAALRKDLDEAKDRMLRARAELENFRARTNREIANERKYASLDLIRNLLPVWDNLGRALEAVRKTHNTESLAEGVQLVYEQFVDVLKKHHCEKIEALHQQFDPHRHASIAQLPNAEFPPNTVIEETQTGFALHDRVVRPAQVVLAGAVADGV